MNQSGALSIITNLVTEHVPHDERAAAYEAIAALAQHCAPDVAIAATRAADALHAADRQQLNLFDALSAPSWRKGAAD